MEELSFSDPDPSAPSNLHTPSPAPAAFMVQALARDGMSWKTVLQTTESLGLFEMDFVLFIKVSFLRQKST